MKSRALFLSLCLTACEGAVAPNNPTPPAPPVEPPAQTIGKSTRRLTIEQLRRSIPALFSGITWTISLQGQEIQLFEGLSRTLGEADYDRITTSNEDPGALFAKFMDDMAADVCAKAIARDLQTPLGEARLIMRHEDPQENLRFLKLKLHAQHVPVEDDASIAELNNLFESVSSTEAGGAPSGWFAVCVAMLTAPEFMAY